MTKWKGTVHGYGGGREQLSDDSATVQLSLVDADSQPIPVNNSLQDFIMYIPRSEETSAEPTLVGTDGETIIKTEVVFQHLKIIWNHSYK